MLARASMAEEPEVKITWANESFGFYLVNDEDSVEFMRGYHPHSRDGQIVYLFVNNIRKKYPHLNSFIDEIVGKIEKKDHFEDYGTEKNLRWNIKKSANEDYIRQVVKLLREYAQALALGKEI